MNLYLLEEFDIENDPDAGADMGVDAGGDDGGADGGGTVDDGAGQQAADDPGAGADDGGGSEQDASTQQAADTSADAGGSADSFASLVEMVGGVQELPPEVVRSFNRQTFESLPNEAKVAVRIALQAASQREAKVKEAEAAFLAKAKKIAAQIEQQKAAATAREKALLQMLDNPAMQEALKDEGKGEFDLSTKEGVQKFIDAQTKRQVAQGFQQILAPAREQIAAAEKQSQWARFVTEQAPELKDKPTYGKYAAWLQTTNAQNKQYNLPQIDAVTGWYRFKAEVLGPEQAKKQRATERAAQAQSAAVIGRGGPGGGGTGGKIPRNLKDDTAALAAYLSQNPDAIRAINRLGSAAFE